MARMGLLAGLWLVVVGLLAAPDLARRVPQVDGWLDRLRPHTVQIGMGTAVWGVVGLLWGVIRFLGMLGVVTTGGAFLAALIALAAWATMILTGLALCGERLPAMLPDRRQEQKARTALAPVIRRRSLLGRVAPGFGLFPVIAAIF